MILVIATVELKPSVRETYLGALGALRAQVQAEEGCLEYRPYIDTASGLGAQLPLRADVVTIIERWASLEALRAHAVAAHMQAYRERVKNLVQKTTLQVLSEPAAGG